MQTLGTQSLNRAAIALMVLALSAVPSLCSAQTKAAIDTSVTAAVTDFDRLDTHHASLLANAAGALIFPHLIKGGIALSNEFGEGVLQIQGRTVGYYSFTSVSVGLTAGMESHSAIVLFMTQTALDAFRRSRGWSVGAENSVALLTRGVSGDYDSNTLHKPILGFVFAEQGLMADASIEGAKITRLKK